MTPCGTVARIPATPTRRRWMETGRNYVGLASLMRAPRPRILLPIGLAVAVMVVMWAWETRAWGAAYRPWDADAATQVEEEMHSLLYGNVMLRMKVQMTLVGSGPDVVRPLLPYLVHEDFRARRMAATVLGYVGDWSVVTPLVARLDDPHPGVRKASVLALHRIATSHAAAELQRHTHDPDGATRAAIAVALGDLEDPANVDALLSLLADEHGTVRQMATISLGRQRNARAVPGLIGCLRDPQRRTRLAAARSLAMCTGLPAHGDADLWRAWWALHHPN